MLRQRFALNKYCVPGCVFLGVGGLLTLIFTPLWWLDLLASPVMPFRMDVLMIAMGLGFALMGLVFTPMMARMGRLGDDPELARHGIPVWARVALAQTTTGVSTRGEGARRRVVTQVFRIDLDIPAATPYRLRIHRSLAPGIGGRLAPGTALPVRLDPSDPRRVAVVWDELWRWQGAA